jgi:hypothetical protein
MRIVGPSGPRAATSSPAARRTGSGTFTLPQEETQAPAAGSAVRGFSGIDALIALQGIDSPEERRRRGVRRGRSALDVLDELKIALLSGSFDPAAVGRLRAAAAELKDLSGDPGLDAVLAQIELRVEVELAKIARPGAGVVA